MARPDPDLWPVISTAAPREIALLMHVLDPSTPEMEWEEGTAADAHDTLLRKASHAVGRATGRSSSWDRAVRAVARILSVEQEYVELVDLEQRIAARFVARVVERLNRDPAAPGADTLEQLPAELAEQVRALPEFMHLVDEAFFPTVARALAAVPPDERGAWVDRVRWPLVQWLLGRTVRKRGVLIGVTALGVGVGPLALAAKGAVLMADVAGPKLSVVLPAIVWVAMHRMGISEG